MAKNLYNKVFEKHTVKKLSSGQYQLFMGLHMIHEVTSPQAFDMIEERGLNVRYPHRTFATVDHIIPTDNQARPLRDTMAEEMFNALETNTAANGIEFFNTASGKQGIVHIIAPEQGLTQPGMTICCGDSHTSTHGAFGSLAFGIGTSQVRDVLATQTLAAAKLKVRRVEINGTLRPGIYAKDVALFIINRLGVKGGVGFAYEYAGDVFDNMTMDERMTVCNMAIEGGARIGYVNPDQTTYDYLAGRPYAPSEEKMNDAISYWDSIRSDENAEYDDVVIYDANNIEPFVTWGIAPDQSVAVNACLPSEDDFSDNDKPLIKEAYEYMAFTPGEKLIGKDVDVAFIGSCTNGRLSDFEEVISLIKDSELKVPASVKALIVPGSQEVRQELISKGYDKIFEDKGFEFREAGCSMCLAMNPDKLIGNQICASTSNRNFKGRQGSSTGRTLLMSPAMVAAAALTGKVVDARETFSIG
ncbi:3-isopropylmalate dehydratase large subunit [Lentisphaera profundi]|uniref:3-isopropylmalate dehydratase n=1 Tax=Lentisphaera profundi TaxID=1658616 RepID=A0ABY7VQ30_9BACT|nr:3-isopropylmalate dehydratase large subunit [Lentisphaera profundi]WDE95824.1 3-isopropylmalate dehydratase large subunit [Lentisphaera profundi]